MFENTTITDWIIVTVMVGNVVVNGLILWKNGRILKMNGEIAERGNESLKEHGKVLVYLEILRKWNLHHKTSFALLKQDKSTYLVPYKDKLVSYMDFLDFVCQLAVHKHVSQELVRSDFEEVFVKIKKDNLLYELYPSDVNKERLTYLRYMLT